MSGPLSPAALRIEPSAIPAVRAAFDASLAELKSQLVRLRQEGYISQPWLGDPVSAEAVTAYNGRVMDAPNGSYAAMVAYEAELLRIRDSLQAMEDHYRRTEGENAALWGRA
jgi:alkylhydroperoxidase family enzyme